MQLELSKKITLLHSDISRFRSVAVAFSGGVDSTFLAYVCGKVLGKHTILITATSSTYPKRELNDAIEIARSLTLDQIIIESDELNISGFSQNPHNRCYFCKKELFTKLLSIAKEKGCGAVFDGNNASDTSDYRPGRIAARELGVVSPLEDAGLTKDDIRVLSREFNLSTADKPAMACLASRFPYGEIISREKLSRVECAENFLHESGFSQFRVRSHGDLARLEFIDTEIDRAFTQRSKIQEKLNELGFTYCCIDMKGYRTGAMNEVLPDLNKRSTI